MEIKIIPHHRNIHPLEAMLIRSPSATMWVRELQALRIVLADIQVFPIPDLTPNSVWGCLVVMNGPIDKTQAGRHELCQHASPNLFIPERSTLFPALTESEMERIFSAGKYIAHPDFGWVELEGEVNFDELLTGFSSREATTTKPASSTFIPKTIRSLRIQAPPPEEVLENLTENMFPRRRKLYDESLTFFERIKLSFYKALFAKVPDKAKNQTGARPSAPIQKTNWGSRLATFIGKIFPGKGMVGKLQQDFEDLEKRNQKHAERLMDMLRDDPDEALKYAIPLDEYGGGRGDDEPAALDLLRRWSDFSWKGNNSKTSGKGTVSLGDHFHLLQKQYNETAEALVKKGDYEKAAFIYMKLLKNYVKAAETLEAGKHYAEAATIYLKRNYKLKAAQCYEKGNMTMDAIDLYEELLNHEKVGDLYMTLSNRTEAFEHYQKVVDNYAKLDQYVKASLLFKNKMDNPAAGQAMLRKGWDTNKDAVNCLHHYFTDISDTAELEKEIKAVCRETVTDQNRDGFLTVLQNQYRKQKQLREPIAELAYELVAQHIPVDPSIVSRLHEFNPENKTLFKDTLRFKLSVNKKKGS